MLAEAGFAEYFTHGTGHGVGLLIHESPWLRAQPGNDVLADAGRRNGGAWASIVENSAASGSKTRWW